jgi:hypothetical protein
MGLSQNTEQSDSPDLWAYWERADVEKELERLARAIERFTGEPILDWPGASRWAWAVGVATAYFDRSSC